jgi:D-glycerate 3-kinase
VKGPAGWQTAFLERHRLPSGYLDYAQQWFAPLAARVVAHQNSANRGILVGINGSQGSGKSTLCDYLQADLAACHGKRAIALSLDDFYLTRSQRARLAAEVHPLLATRGVPGTHDLLLLVATLDALLTGSAGQDVAVPRFDKARDDRRSREDWDRVSAPVDVVLLEGWCLGARAETGATLSRPVNDLERQEDVDGRWRNYVNEKIRSEFEPFYDRIDRWVMLCAPSFDCVYRWRREQEDKLALSQAGKGRSHVMDDQQLARFIQHFQRITGRCLEDLPPRVHHLYLLDDGRQVTGETHCEQPLS